MTSARKIRGFVAALLVATIGTAMATAAPFTASYLDGNTWNTLYGQGFNAFVNDGLTEPVEFGMPVPLSRFEFFKSGNADTATNIQLAILEPFYIDLTNLTTESPGFVGVSTNTIPSTASIPTGAPLRFNFDNLELLFGNYYGAIFVNIDEAGVITPVPVSAIHADFVEVDDPNSEDPAFVPESNYDVNPPANINDYLNGAPVDFNTSTTNFISEPNEFGTYFFGFSYGADANFIAYFDYEFPPGTPGDFDQDGDVDGRDFLTWQRDPNVGNLTDWQMNYGTSGLAAAIAVPEPASALLIACFFAFCAATRMR